MNMMELDGEGYVPTYTRTETRMRYTMPLALEQIWKLSFKKK